VNPRYEPDQDKRDRQELAELEPHMHQDDGCRDSMFLECRVCDRYYELDDRILARVYRLGVSPWRAFARAIEMYG
jgi:hypothetical protein